jgi:CRP/FNR family cyclic AMP-dependent transcriptional regulator
MITLGEILPDALARIPTEDLELAQRLLLMPVHRARDEDLIGIFRSSSEHAFDFVVTEGVVLKETTLCGRAAYEILGPGDVLAPPLTTMQQADSRATSRYLAHGPACIAVLDERFRQAARKWPVLSDALHACVGRQTHRASMHLAMMHLPHVEDRILALFADLAERFGHVTTDGIDLDLRLTHNTIGQLVGSRRPTVSLALTALAEERLVERVSEARWRVSPPVLGQDLGRP